VAFERLYRPAFTVTLAILFPAPRSYTFNICGNVSTPCNHKGASQYTIASHGMMTQT
jgi:hypothetical protein